MYFNAPPKKVTNGNNKVLVQLIGYFGMPSLDVLSAVWAAHENGAALP